ncbi:MAG: HD domain-containing phosphohydrolase [Candidatus Omnitrophota bacterium]
MKKKSKTWDLFFDKLLQKAMLPIVVTDKKGKIIFTNESYRGHFGHRKKVLIGKNWIDDCISTTERSAIRKMFSSIRGKGLSCLKFNAPLETGARRPRPVQWIGILLEKDNKFFLMSIGRPVTGPRAGFAKGRVIKGKAREMYAEAIAMLFVISKVIDPDIAEHSSMVTSMAVDLAKKLKIGKVRIDRLKTASYLHDIGKLAVSEKILNKRGPLTKGEFEKIKEHSLKGVEMVRPLYFLRDVIDIIQSHHENYDGTGYPHGIKGKNIPLEARILSIADVYGALTSDRPYRKAFSKKEALSILEEGRGRKFDPELIDIFIGMVKKKKKRKKK